MDGNKEEMIDHHKQPTFDTRCIVHTGQYFPLERAAEKCLGEVLKMPNFWQHSASGDLTAFICERHADDFIYSSEYDRSYLTEQIKKFRCPDAY